jgi:hypothetical protein
MKLVDSILYSLFESCKNSILAENLHYLVKVGRIHTTCHGNAEEHTYVGNRALKGFGVSLILLHIGAEAAIFGNLFDIIESVLWKRPAVKQASFGIILLAKMQPSCAG